MYQFLPDHFIQDTILHSKRLGGLGFSWIILLIGAHWGVNQLDRSLSHIFGLRVKPHRATRKYHLFRRMAVVVVGLVFLVILMTAGFELIMRRRAPFFSSAFSLTILPALLGLILTTLILQHLPRRHVRFIHALLGASITTAFWLLAKWGFGIYLQHTPTWGILYGSLGSLMAALVFLYYSCCLFLLGAEVTAAFYRHDTARPESVHPLPKRQWMR
jgi:membrane protein